ncbi:hypothetical protein [Speluncibacter jeojiensis]|uniref:TrwC relaxase domain-containing protein n=1 Tax=Speluncibacter jeojiensis TaxID=2710754 RepID=A0A9X4M462_9ACTN|nr:hypothetical protein [Corynebacteriales bacterium D3-21]
MLTATDFVRNGDRWTLNNVHPDGSVTATRIGDAARTITLPAEYVREHVTLGYARTIHGAQGITAESCHVVATGAETRQLAYVALTRGKRANHLYLGTAHDGDPETVLRREVLSPPTAVDVLTGILSRDGAQKSATTTARELADLATRLAAAAAAFEDAVGTAAEHQAGAEKLARIDAAAEQIHPGLTDAPAYPVLRRRLAALDLELDGTDPIDRLAAVVDSRELATAADPAAVLDWRLAPDPTGSHGAGQGLVPWLPKIPMMLTIDAAMADYLGRRRDLVTDLGRRRDLVTDLAAQVHARAAAWDTALAPRWARPLLAAGQRELVADLAVARAAFAVPDADRRPTGPHRTTAAQRRAQQRLDARAAEVLGDPHAHTGRWQPLADQLDPRITTDPYWPELAERFTTAHQSGIDVPALAGEAVAGRPLPDELPAAALWWRLCDRITAEGCDAAATTDGENPQAPPVLTPQQFRDGLSVNDFSRALPAAAAGTVVAERQRALEHATTHLTAEANTFVLSQDPTARATQIRDYAHQIHDFYEQRARTLLGELLPDHNMRTLEGDTAGWRQVTRQIGRTDMAERDTPAIVLTAVKELQKVGKAKGFDQAGNTPARVLARQIAAARGPLPERTDDLQHIGLLLPPPHTNPATPLARTAKTITTAIREHTDTAERDQPTWVTALGDPGADPRRHRLRREVIEAITSHRMFTGTALEDPDPMGGVHPDTNGPMRDAITAIDGRHYRADHARMSDQELATARSLATARLVETRTALAAPELRRAARTEAGMAALEHRLDALEDHPHIQRELADVAAIDAERHLRTIPGYAPPARKAKPTRPAPAATTSNFTYDMGYEAPRDTGYGL